MFDLKTNTKPLFFLEIYVLFVTVISFHYLFIDDRIIFSVFFFLLACRFHSKFIFSPLTILLSYYFFCFVLTPFVATTGVFTYPDLGNSSLIYTYVASSLFVLAKGFSIGIGRESGADLKPAARKWLPKNKLRKIFFHLAFVSVAFAASVVLMSKDPYLWFIDPGQAFFVRHGTGVYYIGLTTSLLFLSAFTAIIPNEYNHKLYTAFFVMLLICLSPIVGSKGAFLTCLGAVAYMRYPCLEWTIKRFVILFSVILVVFLVSTYMRTGAISLHFITYRSLFNYFSSYANLSVLLADFNGGWFETFFLPFNKFQTVFGNPDGIYHNLNHMLTDHYFPDKWKIRATEQWPLEADLYLNFQFWFGLPLVFLLAVFTGKVFKIAVLNGVGFMLLPYYMVLCSLFGRLRGTLYTSDDFYGVVLLLLAAWLSTYFFVKPDRFLR